MKISELIKRLEDMENTYGDGEIYILDLNKNSLRPNQVYAWIPYNEFSNEKDKRAEFAITTNSK